MTVMIYCTAIERRFRVKEVYDFASNYLRSWFPLLSSYTAFVMRINHLAEFFRLLLSAVLKNYALQNRSESMYITDSTPVIICSAKRRSKVVTEVADKSYCATKSLYYYGVKAHFLASRVAGTHPFPARENYNHARLRGRPECFSRQLERYRRKNGFCRQGVSG